MFLNISLVFLILLVDRIYCRTQHGLKPEATLLSRAHLHWD